MKRFLVFLLILCCITGLIFTGCQKKESSKTLTLLFYSPELQSQYNEMVEAYKTETGVTLDIVLTQGNYRSLLAGRINSGDAPDVFMSSAYADNLDYRDYTYDLSREDFIKNISPAALEGVMLDGKITGYPFLVQSHSFIYNKKVFRDAGITQLPRTQSEFAEVCRRIEAIGVQPFATGFFEWWVLPQTGLQALAPAVVQKYGGFANFVSRLNSGSLKFADVPEMANVFDLLDLIKRYGGQKPGESDFGDQCSSVATGQVAMIHQGIWAEDSIKQVNPGVEIGFLVGPAGNDASGAGIMFDSNQTLRVYKDSKNLKEVLDWLRWLTNSEYGKNWIPGRVKQLSPVASAAAPDSDIARETVSMVNNGVPAYPWFYQMFPSGSEEGLGTILQGYTAGLTDRRGAIAELDDAYTKLARAAQ
ncbi:MAG: extracellular solute-binding protein [Treponema sp.]|jgi:raffinose/stachyose/melibiose transport system substrate-binding protein|nr:extracellular solute-binding protein [Treponema sp.]